MAIQVRKAIEADMSQILELITALAVFENEPDAVEVTVADLEREGLGENPLFTCFIAENDNEIIGLALVYFRFSTWKGRTVHLEDLIVKEAYRSKGIGQLLYNEVMKFGLEHGVKQVTWIVLNWNEGAIRFYERSGATLHKDWYLVEMGGEKLQQFK
ncbi:MAG: GNAT superfamily N-acetyltransferase [Candidatus Latescibacterota bacterium]|jgi:GNAT superfamily N-acetyltransferase